MPRCEFCDKFFFLNATLNRHIATLHWHERNTRANEEARRRDDDDDSIVPTVVGAVIIGSMLGGESHESPVQEFSGHGGDFGGGGAQGSWESPETGSHESESESSDFGDSGSSDSGDSGSCDSGGDSGGGD